MSTIEDAAVVLARASLFDPTIRGDDPAITAAWADALEPHRLDRAGLLDAVTRHYSEAGARTVRPGDVIRLARDARQHTALRANAAELTPGRPVDALSAPPGPSGRAAGLNARGGPIRAAYEVDGAITYECPRCAAQPGQWCTRAGDTLRIPCTERLGLAYRASDAEVTNEPPTNEPPVF